ncbi:MAG: FMN-binding protein [Vicinamibacteria bacterium]
MRTQSIFAAAALLAIVAGELWAGLYKTQKQALDEAFPGGGIERTTAFLTDAQTERVEELSQAPLTSKVVSYYLGLDAAGQAAGVAFFDTHVVRTTTETVMVLIKPDGTVRRVEILAFYEPEDYRVRQSWLDRMNDEDLSADLTVGRRLVRVTGATLTVRALAAAVRRALALHQVLRGESGS